MVELQSGVFGSTMLLWAVPVTDGGVAVWSFRFYDTLVDVDDVDVDVVDVDDVDVDDVDVD